MDIILSAVTKQETKKVVFGFTPRETGRLQYFSVETGRYDAIL
ncbi:hypothetical protein T3H97_14810 [Paenibacillus sp. LX16]|nr:hypothetical protein [Paenibacillus sp. LX16]